MNRITFTQIHDVVLTNLFQNIEKISKTQEQLSSGKRINRPSDAPVDITNNLELRSEILQRNQQKRNTDDGQSYLLILDSAMMSSNDLMQRVRELAIQGSSDTYTSDERMFIRQEINQLMYQLISISNTKHKGDYVFSGKNTDFPPFSLRQGRESIDAVDNSATDPTDTVFALSTPIQLWDRNVTDSATVTGHARVNRVTPGSINIQGLREGVDFTVDYLQGQITFLTPASSALAASGDLHIDYEWIRRGEHDMTGSVLRELETGVVAKINVSADDVYGSELEMDAFKALISLSEGLHKNLGTQIRQSIGYLDANFQRMLSTQAVVGSRNNRMEMTVDRTDGKILEATRMHSILEDLDFAEAISRFTLQESVYNASLQAAARVLKPTLMNFL